MDRRMATLATGNRGFLADTNPVTVIVGHFGHCMTGIGLGHQRPSTVTATSWYFFELSWSDHACMDT